MLMLLLRKYDVDVVVISFAFVVDMVVVVNGYIVPL